MFASRAARKGRGVTGASSAALRVAAGGTMPVNSPPTNTRLPASARARARPALSFSSSEGLVPQVDFCMEAKNWGAGPLATSAVTGLTAGVEAGAGAPPTRAAMPTMAALTPAGAPSAAASPKAKTLPEAATCQ